MTAPLRKLFAGTLFAVSASLIAAAGAFALEIREIESPGGIRAWHVHEPSIPIIAVELAFRGGSLLDPAGAEGLAHMVSGLLDEGAGELDSRAFQERLADHAIEFSAHARRETFDVGLRTLTENREEAFRLLGLALTSPRFDIEPVERVRRQILSKLKQDENDPGEIAGRTWQRVAFPDHPFGRPPHGTAESVQGVTIAQLGAFVDARLARDNVVIAVVGDIDADELGRLLDLALGDLPEVAASTDIAAAWPARGGATIVVRQDIPQSIVRFGLGGLAREDPDFYAAYVMNSILGGGGFTSRLYHEVREKRGLAYSVYTYIQTFDRGGVYMGGAATANERVAETIAVIREELDRLVRDGVTAEELRRAKDYVIGAYPLRLTSNASIANALINIQLDDLGMDYLERRAAEIEAVTGADVHRVARRLIRTDDLIVVVVGDPAGIDASD